MVYKGRCCYLSDRWRPRESIFTSSGIDWRGGTGGQGYRAGANKARQADSGLASQTRAFGNRRNVTSFNFELLHPITAPSQSSIAFVSHQGKHSCSQLNLLGTFVFPPMKSPPNVSAFSTTVRSHIDLDPLTSHHSTIWNPLYNYLDSHTFPCLCILTHTS
jgi:hypothetical protein